MRKPGALAGSTALAAARASGLFTADHQRFWTAARTALGDGAGTRALIGVLLLHRTMTPSAVTAGMAAAIADGVFDADLVAVHARSATCGRAATPPITLPATAAPAATDHRPAPSLAGYDQLLTTTNQRPLEEAIA